MDSESCTEARLPLSYLTGGCRSSELWPEEGGISFWSSSTTMGDVLAADRGLAQSPHRGTPRGLEVGWHLLELQAVGPRARR